MTPSYLFKSGPNQGLVRAKSVRDAAVARLGAHFDGCDAPDACATDLGMIETPDGAVRLIARHAVDLVVTDEGAQRVVLIKRRFPPGAGKWALPGGFMDASETQQAAALREAEEETGLIAALRKSGENKRRRGALHQPERLGRWRTARRFDIRGTQWLQQPLQLGPVVLRPGDLMAVTTQPFWLRLPKLGNQAFSAGDDAAGLRIAVIGELAASEMAVRDHLDIIHLAAG